VRGRKKEVIVTPEGLNVFPEDVERTLNAIPGVRDSAVVGQLHGTEERVHAVLIVEPGRNPEDVVREANTTLEDHQRIRSFTVWGGAELPRTEGTRKLKRAEIKQTIRRGASTAPRPMPPTERSIETVLAGFAGDRAISPATTIEELPQLVGTARAADGARGTVPDNH
jgi:long-chain acyl-CoA synthetase